MSDEKMNQEVDEVEIDVEETSTSDNDTGSDRPDSNQDRLVKTNVSDDSGDDGDELESYSKNVQKRIKKLTEKYRQEERDREEAVRLAQQLHQENQTLKTQMQSSQQGYLNEYGSRSRKPVKCRQASIPRGAMIVVTWIRCLMRSKFSRRLRLNKSVID
jgi:hypothetical protein